MGAAPPSDLLDAVAEIIAAHSQGMSVADICRAMNLAPSEETVVQCVSQLCVLKRIEPVGSEQPTRFRVRALVSSAAGGRPSPTGPSGSARRTAHPAASSPTDATPATASVLPRAVDPAPSVVGRPSSRKLPSSAISSPPVDVSVGGTPASWIELFERSLPAIIGGDLDRTGAVTLLEQLAVRELAGGEARNAFVAYAKGRLEAFRTTEAERYGFASEHYARWRARWHLADRLSARAAALGALAPIPSAPESAAVVLVDTTPAAAGTDEPATRAPTSIFANIETPAISPPWEAAETPSAAVPSAVPAAVPVTVPVAVTTAERVERPVGSPADTELKPLQPREGRLDGLAIMKRLVTRTRVVVALGWGLVAGLAVEWLLRAAILDAAGGWLPARSTVNAVLSILIIPLAGLPWLVLHWFDERRSGTKAKSVDLMATLLIGGAATFVAVRILASLATFVWSAIG